MRQLMAVATAATLALAGVFSTAAAAPVGATPAAPAVGAAAPSPVAQDWAAPQVRIATAGDFTQGTQAAAVLGLMGSLRPDLSLALGDLSYTSVGREAEWCALVTSKVGASHPFELLTGNHESNGLNGLIDNFVRCLPNRLEGVQGSYAKQYTLDVPVAAPLVRIVAISPNMDFGAGAWSYAAGTPRFQWVADRIHEARASGIPWVVVAMHTPCLTIGVKGCEPGADLTNLLIAEKVDLVLSGHDHIYQRTAQLAHGPDCPKVTPGRFDAGCVVSRDAGMRAGRGTVFTTVGTGGRTFSPTNPADPEAPYMVAYSGATGSYGALELTASPDRLSARFHTATGTPLTDAFTLTRDQGATLLRDDFTRAAAAGWGTPDMGSDWPTDPALTLAGERGRIAMKPDSVVHIASPAAATLTQVSCSLELSGRPTSGSAYWYLRMREGPGGYYQVRTAVGPTGGLALQLSRVTDTGSTVLRQLSAVPGLTVSAGTRLVVRAEVTGTAPAVVRVRVWPFGAPEPQDWQLVAADGTAALQRSGTVSFGTLYPAGSTPALTAMVDDLRVLGQ